MNERELGRALLGLDAPGLGSALDPRQVAWRIVERDRRRVRFWTVLTVLTWLLAATMVLGALVAYGFLFPRAAQVRLEAEAGKLRGTELQNSERALLLGFQKGTVLVSFSVAVLAMAALCTVLLVFASRRAILRQVNAGLLEVAEQLKQLRQTRGP